MPSHHQSSLDNFFGVKKKKNNKQTTLKSFVSTAKENTTTNNNTKNDDNKDNNNNDTNVDETKKVKMMMDVEEKEKEEQSNNKRNSPSSDSNVLAKRRRRAIVDDDDDDSDDDNDDNENDKVDSKEKKKKDDDDSDMKQQNEKEQEQEQQPDKQKDSRNIIKKQQQEQQQTKEDKQQQKQDKMKEQKVVKNENEDNKKNETENDEAYDNDNNNNNNNDTTNKLQNELIKKASKFLKALNKSSDIKSFKTNEELSSQYKQSIDDYLESISTSTSTKSKSTKSSSPFIKKTIKKPTTKNNQKNQQHDDDNNTKTLIPYSMLVTVFEQIECITGRLEIQTILTNFLRYILLINPKELYSIIYLASNSVAPAYECVELGIGDSILIKAISEAYGTSTKVIKEKYETIGDLGLVAQTCKSKQRTLLFGLTKPKPILVSNVLNVFRTIASITGSSSQKLKVDKIKTLLVKVQHSIETKYIIRGLQGKLRIGLAQSTVLISLAHALSITIPNTIKDNNNDNNESDMEKKNKQMEEDNDNDNSTASSSHVIQYMDESLPIEKRLEGAVNIIKQVYSEVPSYDALLDAALTVPLYKLQDACSFQPGIPVTPMLAKPTKSLQEVLKRLNGVAFTCEYKYDGERAQIHKTLDGTLKVFSRNLLQTTSKFPEVPLFVQQAAEEATTTDKTEAAESFVLDAEVVAYNPKTQQLVPFQVLSTRKKTEESAETAKVQVIVKAFDLMYLNGTSLLNTSLQERRTLLHKYFKPIEGKFQFATSLDCSNGKDGDDTDTSGLESFLDLAVKGQCEGLMIKTINDVYEPSRRSLNWLKLKKDYLDGLGDSFDLVPLGAYYGKGKRTGVYGAYLLACYDEETEEYQSVCKIGTGFSDDDLKTLSETLNKHKLNDTGTKKSSQYNVSDNLECDVWFDTIQVWEIKAADLSKSSLHRGATGKLMNDGDNNTNRGIGLRFPRFERIRTDKKPEQATTSDQILDMYYQQDTIINQQQEGGVAGDDDDDGI